MNMNNNQKSNNTLEQQKQTLQQIIQTLNNTNTNNFTNTIKQYGTINYTRTQYLPQLSKTITENQEHQNKLYNYTSLESMILDLLEHIESNTIKKIENTTTNQQKTKKQIQYTTTLLQLLQQTLNNNNQEQITQTILQTQNQYYQLIYNEKTDTRIK